MNNCMIYDFETLGQDVLNCPALSLAAYSFDTERFISDPYTLDEVVEDSLYMKLDVTEQVKKYGRVIEKDTVDWWSKQSKAAQVSQLRPLPNDLSIDKISDALAGIYENKSNVYTRGNTFDPVLLDMICKITGTKSPYPWWSIRDMRSMIDGLSFGSNISNSFMPDSVDSKAVVLHDPRYDIALDVLRYQTLVQAIS